VVLICSFDDFPETTLGSLALVDQSLFDVWNKCITNGVLALVTWVVFFKENVVATNHAQV
jgi:hypothetical protein